MSEKNRLIEIDATDKPIGRLATSVATYLRGKHLASFTPNLLPGVRVRVKHVSRVHITAVRRSQPVYRFSGYPGGLKQQSFERAFTKNPTAVFRNVVRRMLPDNRLRKRLLRFLILEV